jgi:hypothetical protein
VAPHGVHGVVVVANVLHKHSNPRKTFRLRMGAFEQRSGWLWDVDEGVERRRDAGKCQRRGRRASRQVPSHIVSRCDCLIGGPKVRGYDRVDFRLARRLAPPPSRHQEKGSRISRRAVSLPRPPTLAVERDVMEQLFRLHQQVVEPVNFWPGVRQPLTLEHDRVKTIVIVGVERKQQRDDRVPRVSPDCTYDVATHFALETSVRRNIDVKRSTID